MTLAEPARIPAVANSSSARRWLYALERTAFIGKHPHRILSTVIEEMAEALPGHPALLSDRECMSYAALAARSNQYTRWALDQGLNNGDVVALIMPNRPEYMAIWLGISRAGCTVALVNHHLTGTSLRHSLAVAGARCAITAVERIEDVSSALAEIPGVPTTLAYGAGSQLRRIDREVEQYSGAKLAQPEVSAPTIHDRALLIYTSGTTGLPKAANVSHARLMQWTQWFAGLLEAGLSDRLYNCLPMYHSAGGILATGAVLACGGSVVIREQFSASEFWKDIVRWDCTLFQYIGELCRYLLHTPKRSLETEHRIRIGCGNGLRRDIWDGFKSRFRIPEILEFYAATEGNVSFFNVGGKPGSIGKIPPFMAHRVPAALVRFNHESGEPQRDRSGFCIRCSAKEAGEAIGRIVASSTPNRFEGYTSAEESAKKILHDVFEPGDAWYRTGDLMRQDEQGYFYFVDRIGDTFRWKGENVATAEVEQICRAFPGVTNANVYGVTIPATDGRAGMAAIVPKGELDLPAFREHLNRSLPAYAQPVFLRLCKDLQTTPTFKYIKNSAARETCDPAAVSDALYFNDTQSDSFIPVTAELYRRIETGEIRI